MSKLELHSISDIDDLAWPEDIEDLHLHSPAVAFFTDFLRVKPMIVEANVSAANTQLMMRKAHVRLKFVVDSHQRLLGVVNSDDLSDEKIVQRVSEGFKREDLLVSEFMTPKKSLSALTYSDVARATITDVIATLKDNGERHCLVLDEDAHKIRGIFSASDISRKLHLPIDIHQKSSFYSIFLAVS